MAIGFQPSRFLGFGFLALFALSRAPAQPSYVAVPIPALDGGPSVSASAINASGVVVGAAEPPGVAYHAFVYDGGAPVNLGDLGGGLSGANAINSAGVIVGSSWPLTPGINSQAFIYANGVMTAIPSAVPNDTSSASAINDAGTIVINYNSPYVVYAEPAYIYSNGVMTGLGTFGAATTVAYAINAAGIIVGQYSGTSTAGAFRYDNGTMTDLGNLGFPIATAMAINSAGTIVGSSGNGGAAHAFVYTGETMYDLNVLANMTPDVLASAGGINDAGQIVANDFFGHAWILTPGTAVIGVNNLDFGDVAVGSSATATLAITNSGTLPLLVTSILFPAPFSGNWTAGTIPAGSTQDVTVTFAPTVTGQPQSIVTIISNATSGSGRFNLTGLGTATLVTPTPTPAPTPTPTPTSAGGAILPPPPTPTPPSATPTPTPTGSAPTPTRSAGGSRLVNISTRAQVGTGGGILIPGFVVGGTGTDTLLIRADGPSLTAFGVAGALAAPSLTLADQAGAVVATNAGWSTNSNAAQLSAAAAAVGAFPFASGSADSAVLVVLAPGVYTVQVAGLGGTTGVALAEVYETASTGTARIVNLSTRAEVGTGAALLISGFVIQGSGTEKILVRADGPSLSSYGVPGLLAEPSLALYSEPSGTLLDSNTGWATAANPAAISAEAALVGAFAYAANSADSALAVAVGPGSYTAQVSGVGGTAGVALVELYVVP